MSDSQGLRYERHIPVRIDVDVFVAGGGPAGMAAAVAAARQGKTVFLAESLTCFGGMGTAGMLPVFMAFGDSTHFYADGFGREVSERLISAGGAPNKNLRGPYIVGEVLKRVYDDIAAEAGIDFIFQTSFVDVLKSGEHVDAAVCASKSGLFAVRARTYVDATGDGDLCARAGAPFEKGDADGNLQPGTLCSLWANIDWERANSAGNGAWRQDSQLERAFADKVFSVDDRHLPGMLPVGQHVGGGNIGHSFSVDGTDDRSLTEAILRGRKCLLEYERYYKQYLRGYESMSLVRTGSLFGIRETRRITGDYVLAAADYYARAVFDDEIGRYNYWIDIHPSKADPKAYEDHVKLRENPLKDGESYGIPYRTLTPRRLQNVLVAGRCVSTDRNVQASIRVMPGCFITGQAAGIAAAIAADKTDGDVRAFPVKELQRRLKKMGAFLPNFAEAPVQELPGLRPVVPPVLEPGAPAKPEKPAK